MIFEIDDTDVLGRTGSIQIREKTMKTPNLFPVVHPTRNIVQIKDLEDIGAECMFTNAYIIYKNTKLRETLQKTKLHDYFKFDGLIATDSGAFQQYMYDNNDIDINPQIIEEFQENIGSDFPVILDLPVQLDDNYQIAKNKVFNTLNRAKDNIARRGNEHCHWIGPIHGGNYKDLLRKSAREMSALNYDIYALGGLVKAFLDYRFDLTIRMLITVKKHLIPNKPLHMFGLGLPQFFSLAVASGCDLMDSAAYALFAKEERYFSLSMGTCHLRDMKEFPCYCPICCKYTPKELLTFKKEERVELLAKHNLYLSFSELRTIRQAIRQGNLMELVEQRIHAHPNLVKAYDVFLKNKKYIEKFDKIYKKNGRLLSSYKSNDRPLLYRTKKRITKRLPPEKETNILVIFPDLISFRNIPSDLTKIIEKFVNNIRFPLNTLQFLMFNEIYGLIPLGLIQTFPMGQTEHLNVNYPFLDMKMKSNHENWIRFIEKTYPNLERIGLFFPKRFTHHPSENLSIFCAFNELHHILRLKLDLKIKFSKVIQELISFINQ